MKLHFQRFEFKYILSWQEYREIRAHLKRYVVLDGFARQARRNFYEVISLYYDSPKFYFYNEKNDGIKNRKKIRLRTYCVDGKMTDHIFFEIKRKSDAVISKDRFLVPSGAYGDFVGKGEISGDANFLDHNARRIMEEYEYERSLRSLRPSLLVSYSREPYLGRFNKNFRVTFDYNIKGKASRDLLDITNCREVLVDNVVMEVKFNGKLPYYIREIIERYDLQRTSYSKYCRTAESCYLLPDLNISRDYFFNADRNLLTNAY